MKKFTRFTREEFLSLDWEETAQQQEEFEDKSILWRVTATCTEHPDIEVSWYATGKDTNHLEVEFVNPDLQMTNNFSIIDIDEDKEGIVMTALGLN